MEVPVGNRTRCKPVAALKRIWNAANNAGQFGTIVQLLISTGQRRGEIASIQPSWLENDTLVIPAHVAKNGRRHSIPLSEPSLKLATRLATSRSSMQPYNAWSKSKRALDEASGITGYCLHDLRRKFATRLAELGVAPHVI